VQQPRATTLGGGGPKNDDDGTAIVPTVARTVAPGVVVENADLAFVTPVCITFEPIDLLVRRHLPEGLLYRDSMLKLTGLRLPRPQVFEDALASAVARMQAEAPRFGAADGGGGDPAAAASGDAAKQQQQQPLEAWWRAVVREMYESIIVPGIYDETECALFERAFDIVFRELHHKTLVSKEIWEPAPDALRLLSALREWRDERDGPRLGVVSTTFDGRVERLLTSVLGEDVVASTFDFVVGASDPDGSAFELAADKRGQDLDLSRCVHLAPHDLALPGADADELETAESFSVDGAPPDCRVQRITSNKKLLASTEFPSLIDLIDEWGLAKIPEDDVLVTTRTYSVYDNPADDNAFDEDDDGRPIIVDIAAADAADHDAHEKADKGGDAAP